METRIIVPEESAKGHTRREFLKMLELAGISVVMGGTGLLTACEKTVDPLAGSEEVITRCGLCGIDCGMKAYVKENRVLAVAPWHDDPKTKGFMCDMGLATPEIVHAPDRLRNPKKREGESFVDISWDEALDTIANRLTELKKDPGPESLVIHYGVSQVRTPFYRYFLRRFSNVYGTPNFTGCGSQCHVASVLGKTHSTGWLHPDYENTKCMIQWGCNPSTSNVPDWLHEILPAKERGAKLICIDPRDNPMTQMADIHLRPRPGTDGALALSMANVILEKGLHQRDSINNHSVGFDAYQRLVSNYPPHKATRITGIPANDIQNAAIMFAENAPACITTGNAIELHANGVQSVRAIMLLHALTGNVDVAGSGLIAGKKARLADMEMKDRQVFDNKGITTESYPLLWKKSNMITANKVPEAILTGKPYPVKALIVVGGNPVMTGPNALHMKAAYEKLDLMVVMDLFMTETAKMADIVLPSATFLESDNFKATDRIYMSPQVIAAQGDVRPTWRFWSDLAQRMGYRKEFPWNTLDEAIDDHVAPVGLKSKELRKTFNGISYRAEVQYKKYERDGFQTPSGKIEFYSQALADVGYDPLPTYAEPNEGPENKALSAEYPFVMTSGGRSPYFYHSQFRNISSLRAKCPEPLVEMNPEDAAKMGVEDGDVVTISSPRGSIRAKVTKVHPLGPGLVAMAHGWKEANVNELTDDAGLDPISGFPAYRGFLCRVEKAEEDREQGLGFGDQGLFARQ